MTSPDFSEETTAALPGVLSRVDLNVLVQQGGVVRDSANVLIGQDTIKLHAGDVAWLSQGGSPKRLSVSPNDPVKIAPGDTVTVVTQESIVVPLNLTGCVYPRGRLLPLGILSTAVHIDPGFSGRCRIILFNLGKKAVTLPFGYEVARLQLTTLVRQLSTPYIGVNAELHSVNPQADELVVESGEKSEAESVAEKTSERLAALEAYVEERVKEKRRRRIALAIVGAIALIALLVLIALVVGRAASGTSIRDLTSQIVAAIVAAFVAIGVGVARLTVRDKLSEWLGPRDQEKK